MLGKLFAKKIAAWDQKKTPQKYHNNIKIHQFLFPLSKSLLLKELSEKGLIIREDKLLLSLWFWFWRVGWGVLFKKLFMKKITYVD